MPDFILNFFGPQIINWVITGLVGWGVVQLQRQTGIKISKSYSEMFQTAVSNAAGVIVNMISAGTLTPEAAKDVAIDLAMKLIRDNKETVTYLGVNNDVGKVADKILDKAAGLSVASPDETVTVIETPKAKPQAPVYGSVPHRN